MPQPVTSDGSEVAAQVVARARERSGFDGDLSQPLQEGLTIFGQAVRQFEREKGASAETVIGFAVEFLANRMGVERYAAAHPDLLERSVDHPVFVLGMPRTGTTILSHLLSLDESRRSLLRWESFQSAPPARAGMLRSDPRCLAMRETLNPDSAIHEEQPDLPTECIIPMAAHFRSMLWTGMLDSALYRDWYLNADMSSTYAYHKQLLQVLQAENSGRWLLKAPAHALSIDALFDAYPDATVIWTHRDPYRAFASACSFTSLSLATFGPYDRRRAGHDFLELFTAHVRRPMKYEERAKPGSMIHVRYADFIRNPISVLEGIYSALGETFEEDSRAAMVEWLGANPQHSGGTHDYDLERFGVTESDLAPGFEDYVERYAIEREAA